VVAAIEVGTQLFVHDTSAARASDELMSRKIFERDKRIGGWLTDVDAERSTVFVTFIGEENGAPAALHRVSVPAGGRAVAYEALTPAQPLDDSHLARWKARGLAIDAFGKRKDLCSEQHNIVVLPPEPARAEVIRVYVLAATTKSGVIVAGGHFRYEYSADGVHLESQRGFTKSCFEMPAPEKGKGKPVAFMMTHLLDPTPTEIHVFLSRLHDQTVFVGTEEYIWVVAGGEILLVERLK
jgi:hypothetical protein